MKILAPLRLRVEENTITRVNRRLIGTGSINAKVGQEVTPADIIGSSEAPSGFRTLNLATLLSVSPTEAKKYLRRGLGQRIYKGELLAYKDSWLFGKRKIVTAPTDAILDFINEQTGELRLSFLPIKTALPAGVYGIIEHIDNLRGVVSIRTQVSRVYGIFGTGRMRDGILRILSRREDLVRADMIRTGVGGEQIIVGGSLVYKDAISSAISSGVNGIITGGINAEDYKNINGGRLSFSPKLENDIGISIVVTEGFGSLPIGMDIYKVLNLYNGKFVFVDGNKAVISLPSFESKSMLKIRSTSLPQEFDAVLTGEYLQTSQMSAGLNVRIIGDYFMGEQGKVIAIDQTITALSSGVKAILATVETSFRKIKVPVNNLEIIK